MTSTNFRSGRAVWLKVATAAAVLGASTGVHAADCRSDADCESGFECDLPPIATTDCDPSGEGCETAPPDDRVGTCEPGPVTCDADADCPTGLSCRKREDDDCASVLPPSSGDSLAPEGPMCEPSEPSPGECVYELIECEDDTACTGGDVCTALGRVSECNAASAAPCAPGMECPPAIESEEESCTETVVSYCFPPLVDCGRGASCENGTRCVPLPEEAQEEPPPGWEGVTALCLPEGLALAIEGRVEVEGGGGDDDEGGDRSSDSKAQGFLSGSDGGDAAANVGEEEPDRGCSVAARGAAGSASRMALPVLAAVVLGLARRRRSSRPEGAAADVSDPLGYAEGSELSELDLLPTEKAEDAARRVR